MLQSALDILKLRAFIPDICNPQVPYAERFRAYGRPLLGLSLERSCAQMRILEPGPDDEVSILMTAPVEFGSDEQLREEVIAFCREHQLEHAIGLLSYDVVMELRPLPPDSDAADDARLLKEDPSTLLGDDVETEYLYSLLRLPHNEREGLIFAYPKSVVDRLERLSRNAPFSFLQISSGIELYLAHVLQAEDSDHGFSLQSSGESDLVIFDRPTLSILQFTGHKILPTLLCRTDMGDLPPDESVMVINALERYLRDESRVEVICLAGSNSDDAKSMLRVLDDVVGTDRYHLNDPPHPLITLLKE